MPASPARPSLVLPCAVLGAVAGLKIANLLRDRTLRRVFYHLLPEAQHGLFLIGLAICGGIAVGLALSAAVRRDGRHALGWAAATMMVAGIGGGWLLRMITVPQVLYAARDEVVAGVEWAAALLVPVAGVVAASQRAGRARRGSPVRGSDERAVWLPVAAAAALSPLVDVTLDDWDGMLARCMPFAMSRVIAALGLAALAGLLAADVAALVRVRRAAARMSAMERCGADTQGLVGTPLLLDFGLGGGVAVDPAPPAGYRERDGFRGAIVGDGDRAHRALRRAVMLSASALALGAACLLGVWEGPGGECAGMLAGGLR